jgi:putative flippase GtrA
MSGDSSLLGQITRFGFVGATSNLILYLAFLGITGFGVDPKLAMTILYAMGVLQTFFLNKRWTFSYTGSPARSFWRYTLLHLGCYLLNLALLYWLVDNAHVSAAYVQAGAVVLNAGLLFLAQKYWVFARLGS